MTDIAEAPPVAATPKRSPGQSVTLFMGKYGALIVLALLVIVFGIMEPRYFLSWGNIVQIFNQSALAAIIACGLTLVLAANQFDLSIGYTASLSGIAVAALLIAGVPPAIVVLVPVPFAALFLGWLPHNDLAYDSTAVWMHLASGVRGVSDRVGRLVPVLLIGIPLLAIAIPVATAAYGRWAVLPALTGVCVSLFLSALGLSSISSAVAPYAVSRPGESPFQQPERTGSSGAIAQAVVMLGAIVLTAPVLWFAWLTIDGDIDQATIALWTGVGIGVFVFAAGIALGALAFERRGGRLMEFAEAT